MHDRGVPATTLEDVQGGGGSQRLADVPLLPGKTELVQAVIDYQADTIVKHNRQALGSPKGVEAWRKMVVTGVRSTQGKGAAHLVRPAAS
jgi:TetR/AcrR family transcriptional repressor of nem operon